MTIKISNNEVKAEKQNISRGLRVLPSKPNIIASSDELAKLQTEAAKIEQWWNGPRWKHTTRPYTGKLNNIFFKQVRETLNSNTPISHLWILSNGSLLPYLTSHLYSLLSFHSTKNLHCWKNSHRRRSTPTIGGGSPNSQILLLQCLLQQALYSPSKSTRKRGLFPHFWCS